MDSNTFGVMGGCCAACVVVIFILAGIFGNYDDSSTDTVASVINNTTDDTIKPIDFNPTNFTFIYSNSNTSKYKGDLGLKYAYCTNSIDNTTCLLLKEYVRGLAYASNGTFEFKDNLSMVPAPHSRNDSNYTVNEIYYSNGTLIEKLLIEDEDLTLEEREYFQDYEGQKEAYYNKKQQDKLDAIEDRQFDEYNYQTSPKTQRGIIYGPNGMSYYRSF
ncbi:hypothetical protein [Methanosphaera stadtmanae]|uniref:hypothetical protein n=1 Tax=Methanosphaera stadtmanae TaxID=2317 RepID=UPI0026662D8D|nr:hypothetical protein [Methanosphaera stadtmanae]